jgi:hypothetical protein
MRRALTDTGVDWEEYWNQAWVKFSRSYLDTAFVFKGSPEAYLRRILANQVIDVLRQHARETKPQLLGEQDESLEDMSSIVRGVSDVFDGQALACSATRWLGMSASRWVGMTGDGKGPAGGVGGALWCPGCRCGGRVVVVSRLRGRSACPPGRGGHWSFTSVIAARTAVVSAMVL